jgi:hypothetical protein
LTPTGTGYQDGTNNFGDNTYFLTELDNSGTILLWNTYFGDTEDGFIANLVLLMLFSGLLSLEVMDSSSIFPVSRYMVETCILLVRQAQALRVPEIRQGHSRSVTGAMMRKLTRIFFYTPICYM